MKHIFFCFFIGLMLISCGDKKESTQPEIPINVDSSDSNNQTIQEIVEPKNSIVGLWKSKTYNGEKFEALTYKINADSTLEGVNSKGFWSLNGDQFCEKLGKKEMCYTVSINGDTMALTNKIGGIFVFVRSDM